MDSQILVSQKHPNEMGNTEILQPSPTSLHNVTATLVSMVQATHAIVV